MLTRWVAPTFGVIVVLGALGVIEALLRSGVLNRFVMPLPSDVAASLWRVVTEEHIKDRFLLTASEALAAGLLITIVGVPIGVLLRRFELLREATETWVAAFAAAPIVLAYPLFLVIFGRSAWTIIVIGFAAGLPAVILKSLEGLAGVRPVLINVGRAFKLNGWQRFWKIELPAALPTILTGIRLGLVFALINIVGVEFLINFGGLGQIINDLAERYDLPGVYGAIFFVILVSVVFFVSLERIERWLRPES
jgi:ABC-type nitrate/sulfonate/bicarbonate transport system permease component